MLINFIYILIIFILLFVTVVAIRAIKSGLDSRETFSKKEVIVDDVEKNLIEDINRLNDLYSKGILTKEEFEKAKKKLVD